MKNKFGSIEWQDEMIDEINRKKSNNEELNDYEEVFLQVQYQHNSRILEGF